jgi:undecaprenyl-diphosphatase
VNAVKKWFYPLGLVTLIGFAIIFLNLTHEKMIEFDESAFGALSENGFLGLFKIFGDQIVIIIVALILMMFLAFYRKNFRGMLFVLFTVGGGNLLNQVLKKWVERDRPEFPQQKEGFSFPSGNAMVGLLYLFTLTYFLTENISSKATRILIWIGTVVLTLLLGLSRITSNAHYATDVLAGWMAGYSLFIIVAVWYEWRNRQMSKRVTQPE